jgi:hypothetical protein
MRSMVAALMVSFVLATPVKADADAIESVISRQIEALMADDFITAFTFASPMIQGIFGNPENFGMMVRQGYPMVWRPADVQFLDLEEIGGALWQSVLIKDQEGRLHVLEYQMVNGENGWKINAVRFREEPAGTV